MSTDTLTCRCRFCGNVVCYTERDVGYDIRCNTCSQTIRLPGKLIGMATLERSRKKDSLGLGMEIGGFALMFVMFPWGVLVGSVVVVMGWMRTTAYICSNCSTIQPDSKVESCSRCKATFGKE